MECCRAATRSGCAEEPLATPTIEPPSHDSSRPIPYSRLRAGLIRGGVLTCVKPCSATRLGAGLIRGSAHLREALLGDARSTGSSSSRERAPGRHDGRLAPRPPTSCTRARAEAGIAVSSRLVSSRCRARRALSPIPHVREAARSSRRRPPARACVPRDRALALRAHRSGRMLQPRPRCRPRPEPPARTNAPKYARQSESWCTSRRRVLVEEAAPLPRRCPRIEHGTFAASTRICVLNPPTDAFTFVVRCVRPLRARGGLVHAVVDPAAERRSRAGPCAGLDARSARAEDRARRARPRRR